MYTPEMLPEAPKCPEKFPETPEEWEAFYKWKAYWNAVERPMWIVKIWEEIDLSKVSPQMWYNIQKGFISERQFYEMLEDTHPEIFYKNRKRG